MKNNKLLPKLTRRLSLSGLNSETSSLKRVLGPYGLIAFCVGNTIGAGLFSLTGIAAAQNAGPAVVLSFIISAIACGFVAFCYSELAGMMPISGSTYTYTYVAIGEFMAWIIGWALILEYAVGASTVAVSWSGYVVSFLATWHIGIDPRLSASPFETVQLANGTIAHGFFNLPAVAILSAVSILLIFGTSKSSFINTVIVIIKLIIIAIFCLFGFHYVNYANYTPFIPPNNGTFGHYGFSGVMRAAGVIFFAYVGFDSLSTAAQETKNPARNMPIGFLGGLFITTLAYVAFSFVMVGLVNYHDMVDDAAPVATAINHTPYVWLQLAIKLGIIFGFTSVLITLLFGQSRIFFTVSQDGLLPRFFSITHSRFQTPWISNLFIMAFTSFLAAFFPISELGHMTSIGTLFAFVLVCLIVMILRRKEPYHPRTFRVPGGDIIPIMGVLTSGTIMLCLDIATWIRLIAWLVLGIGIYFLYGIKHSKLAHHEISYEA